MSVVLGIMVGMPTPTTAELLAFEAAHPGHPGRKVHEIESAFNGMPAARYYQLLSRAVEDPDAVMIDPMLVHRLRRLRDRADGRRSA